MTLCQVAKWLILGQISYWAPTFQGKERENRGTWFETSGSVLVACKWILSEYTPDSPSYLIFLFCLSFWPLKAACAYNLLLGEGLRKALIYTNSICPAFTLLLNPPSNWTEKPSSLWDLLTSTNIDLFFFFLHNFKPVIFQAWKPSAEASLSGRTVVTCTGFDDVCDSWEHDLNTSCLTLEFKEIWGRPNP